MLSYKKILFSIFLSITLLCLWAPSHTVSALSSSKISFIILSRYKAVADIGDEVNLIAVTSNSKFPTWKSSNSKVASVKYGTITAKKAGTAIITAKIKNAVATCKIIVNETKVTINNTHGAMERGETLKLTASTSNNSKVIWKSSKRSVATVDQYGKLTGLKPGETTITATADGTKAIYILTVKSPTIQLNKTDIKLYRGQTFKLNATVSSKVSPKWKTNKKSVAIVDESGNITAQKNGIATITATVDGISKTCLVTVLKPDITLSATEITLKKGKSTTITATVSSGNSPVWSTSNSKIISIDSNGKITALKKGTAYIYGKEDGTKVKCTIRITE